MLQLALLVLALAGEGHDHDHGPVDLGKLGNVTFATSCKASVQQDFSRAVALMHSFWYAEAEKAFARVAADDPRCAMAHWGVAMANYHPIWAPPMPDELRRGREAAEKARALGAPTERERAYIEAIHAFYADSDQRDHGTRAKAYAQAMSQVAAANPNDDEAAIFHALSILGIASPNDKTYAEQKRAAEILPRILPPQPGHPGIAHYLSHSYDYPALAELALPAARAYAKIAPGSPHALHMPSHIFTRLGLWNESIASNLASAEKARRYVQQMKPDFIDRDELHAIDYLVYAYIQQGDDAKAKALLDRVAAVDGARVDASNFAAAYALGAAPARWALERRQWKEAAQLKLHPANFPWKTYPYAEANLHFARAIGAARSGDLNTAKEAIDRLAVLRQELLDQKSAFWADQVEIQRVSGLAWLANAAGLKEEAVRLMTSAAELEERTEKHPVTPGAVLPARELLADMLLEHGKASEALAEVERALTVAPKRYHGTWLAARAAEAAKDAQKAAAYSAGLQPYAKRW
jgi:hypothetical protein